MLSDGVFDAIKTKLNKKLEKNKNKKHGYTLEDVKHLKNRWNLTGVAYDALVKDGPTEVIRESKASSDGIVSLDELNESRRITSLSYLEYNNDKNFGLDEKGKPKNEKLREVFDDVKRLRDIDNKIGVNIHTSPENESSSEGCQNIPIFDKSTTIDANNQNVFYYEDFLDEIPQRKTILYTLIDSSKINKEIDGGGRPNAQN